jgi:hypothetical protein
MRVFPSSRLPLRAPYHGTFDEKQAALNQKTACERDFCRALFRTRTGDPLLTQATGRNPRQRFWHVSAVSALSRFAADCHRLQPRGFIKAPSGGVCRRSGALPCVVN